MKKLLSLLLVLTLLVSLTGCAIWDDFSSFGPGTAIDTLIDPSNPMPEKPSDSIPDTPTQDSLQSEDILDPEGTYSSKEDVALYIHLYGSLPNNFITKSEARKLGWRSGSVEKFAPGKCIGGDRFGNYEGLLPKAEGRTYTECDIDTLGGKSRGAKRIVFFQ